MRLIDYNDVKTRILKERDKIPRYTEERYEFGTKSEYKAGNYMRGGIRMALRCLEEAETVSVVRCKNCVYAEKGKTNDGLVWCFYFDSVMNDTGFCSRGVKKDNEIN